jgi:hypothetical protein
MNRSRRTFTIISRAQTLPSICSKPSSGSPLTLSLKAFLSSLLQDIAEDRDTLKASIDKISIGSSRVKELAGWVAEKLTQVKLGAADSVSFEIFEALELVELGVRGKLQMWRALVLASAADERLRGFDYQKLIARAEAQYAAVEARRLLLVASVFGRARASPLGQVN